MNNFAAIREMYETQYDYIMEAKAGTYGADPYAWVDYAEMTPIEHAMWCGFRSQGVVMYPQYPVGRYFVDFGNPKAKVAIECDGAEFHTDVEADRKRHREIQDMGWTIYRFTGRECNQCDQDEEMDLGRRTTDNRILAIAAMHGLSCRVKKTDELIQYYMRHEMPRVAFWS